MATPDPLKELDIIVPLQSCPWGCNFIWRRYRLRAQPVPEGGWSVHGMTHGVANDPRCGKPCRLYMTPAGEIGPWERDVWRERNR